jgi:hypothetical protein
VEGREQCDPAAEHAEDRLCLGAPKCISCRCDLCGNGRLDPGEGCDLTAERAEDRECLGDPECVDCQCVEPSESLPPRRSDLVGEYRAWRAVGSVLDWNSVNDPLELNADGSSSYASDVWWTYEEPTGAFSLQDDSRYVWHDGEARVVSSEPLCIAIAGTYQVPNPTAEDPERIDVGLFVFAKPYTEDIEAIESVCDFRQVRRDLEGD